MKLDKFTPMERPELVDNVYFAKILGIDLKVWSEENKSLNWKFELVQPPFIGKRVWVWGSTGTAPTPKARLTSFGAALGYSREALADESFDTDKLIGSYVKVLYQTTTKEDGSTKQSVTQLLPLTEADQQLLQLWLQQAQVTGPAKVAVAASAPGVNLAFSPMQPLAPAPAPVVTQPVITPAIHNNVQPAKGNFQETSAPQVTFTSTQPIGTTSPAQTERKRSSFPF